MALSSVVTRLRPRSHSYSEAVDAYSSGAFEFSVESLRLDESPRAVALSARALLRLRRPAEVVDIVDALLSSAISLTHLEMGELLTHRCAARARIGDFGSVDILFAEAKVAVFAAASSALEAEFLSREAYAHLLVGDLRRAEDTARQVLDVNPAFREPDYFSPIEHSRARAHDVLAFAAARDERYDVQKRCLELALHEFDSTRLRDDVFEAKLLSNLSLFSVDFGDDGYVRERFERLPDSAWLAAPRYEILRSLAWSSALSGDNLGAFRYLRDAIETADTIPKKMRAALDRAYFARQLRQEITAREELDYAERLSARVDWNSVCSDEGELHALVILSREIADSVPVRARRLFEKYKSLKRKLPADFLATNDRRAWAEELEVDATISRAEGNVSRAITLFEEAFEIWDSLGYGVCAALAARNLVSLGVTGRFAEYVEQQCALRPRSWFAASLRQA